MKRLEVLALFELGRVLTDLNEILGRDKIRGFDAFHALIDAETGLIKFRDEQAAFPFARGSADSLARSIAGGLIDVFYENAGRMKFKDGMKFDQELERWKLYYVRSKIDEFIHVFSAECGKSETYFIEQKLGFAACLSSVTFLA